MHDIWLFLSHCLKWLVRGLALALPVLVMWSVLNGFGLWFSLCALVTYAYISYTAQQGVAWAVEIHNATFYTFLVMPVLALVMHEVVPFLAAVAVYFMISYCAEWLPDDVGKHRVTPVEVAT